MVRRITAVRRDLHAEKRLGTLQRFRLRVASDAEASAAIAPSVWRLIREIELTARRR